MNIAVDLSAQMKEALETIKRLPVLPELPAELAPARPRSTALEGGWKALGIVEEAAELALELVEVFHLEEEETIKAIAAELDRQLVFGDGFMGRLLEKADGPIIEAILRRAIARIKARAGERAA